MTYFDRLSEFELVNIFQYDPTYREIIKEEISTDLWKSSLQFWSRNYVIPPKYCYFMDL